MAGESILIIDDNIANQMLLSCLLEAEGYALSTAAHADEALTCIKARRPRLILLDLQLPGMDGFELTACLKADLATRDIIVIAVTAYAMKGDRERALAAGCDDYVSKPINTRTLPALLRRCLD